MTFVSKFEVGSTLLIPKGRRGYIVARILLKYVNNLYALDDQVRPKVTKIRLCKNKGKKKRIQKIRAKTSAKTKRHFF